MSGLSRREREMMDILHRLGKATAGEVLEALKNPPGYSAVRATLRILEEKGHTFMNWTANAMVYVPAQSKTDAAQSALSQLAGTYFGGSLAGVVRTFLSSKETEISPDELNQIAQMIEKARLKEGK